MDIESMLREAFIRDAAKTVSTLSDFLEDPDFEDEGKMRSFSIIVHGIKSSLGNIGEIELSEAARRLEAHDKRKNYDLIIIDAPEFVEGLRALLVKMQESHDGVTEGDDPEDLSDRLQELIKKFAEYNRKGALDIISGIKTCTPQTKEVLETLTKQVLCSDYEEAEATAARYSDEIRKG